MPFGLQVSSSSPLSSWSAQCPTSVSHGCECWECCHNSWCSEHFGAVMPQSRRTQLGPEIAVGSCRGETKKSNKL